MKEKGEEVWENVWRQYNDYELVKSSIPLQEWIKRYSTLPPIVKSQALDVERELSREATLKRVGQVLLNDYERE